MCPVRTPTYPPFCPISMKQKMLASHLPIFAHRNKGLTCSQFCVFPKNGPLTASTEGLQREAATPYRILQGTPALVSLQSIFGFTVDSCAPSIPRFTAEWVGYQQGSGLHNFEKCSKREKRPWFGTPFSFLDDSSPVYFTPITGAAWLLPATCCWPAPGPRCRSGLGFRTWTCWRLPKHSPWPAPHSAPRSRSPAAC